ncbi:MAG: type II secretion system F family protein [Actinomycetales bacterium]|nr:type II secretion system F family protein [Actinomycetales bacterium]
MTALGALAGGLLATGALTAASGLAARRPAAPAERIAPYVAGPSAAVPRRDDLGTRLDAPTIERLLAPSLRSLAVRLEGVLGGSDALQQRLVAAGRGQDTALSFRFEQLTWTVAGLAVAGVLLVLLAATGRPVRPVAALALALVCGIGGALLRDRALGREVARRAESIRIGLPAVADLLALAVASGESPVAALDRVARVARGPLADECRRACHDTASGVSFVDALDAMATRIAVPAVRRFVDGVSTAVQRGTPLADVLRAQAGDARADLHRTLLEVAGRKELLMLMPVVFLVLPTVVLVALFPAVSSLTSLAP